MIEMTDTFTVVMCPALLVTCRCVTVTLHQPSSTDETFAMKPCTSPARGGGGRAQVGSSSSNNNDNNDSIAAVMVVVGRGVGTCFVESEFGVTMKNEDEK